MTGRKNSVEKPLLHAGHRKRLRERFFREGLEQFEDHQVLELLLFHAVPRRDTNELAHLLLQRFGALSAVLEADPKDLTSVDGLGESAAAFLSLIPPLTRRYLTDSACRNKPMLNDSRKTNAYLIPLMAGRTEEIFYTLCLDNSCRLLFPALISRGTVNAANIHPRHVVEAALRHKASSVILAHNHPSGRLEASKPDILLTHTLVSALVPIGIRVLDHVIIAGNNSLSMAADGLM
ncbi:MAG: DNA repair protein RadC [Magnetococcales bacterium]|nr:DNA repair protein RadC [Magnetococcales bacterium]